MTARLAAGPVDVAKSPAAVLKTLPAGTVVIDGGMWAAEDRRRIEDANINALRRRSPPGWPPSP